jgi:hypothetical protein
MTRRNPLSTLEFTPDEIAALIASISDSEDRFLCLDDYEALMRVRTKLEFALRRFEPGGERAR